MSAACRLGERPRQEFGAATLFAQQALQPSASQLFGPRGVCAQAGRIWVADSGHHRLLAFDPDRAGGGAQLCWGQPDFRGEARNAGGAVQDLSLSTPVGLCAVGAGLALADSWNHRVLIWRRSPESSDAPPDLVLGQDDGRQGLANRGAPAPTADSLHWPSGLYWDEDIFAVADSGNRRVLIWHGLPQQSGQAADLVLGQLSMQRRDQNGGVDLDAAGMVWPHALARWCGDLVVADAGCNRIMRWSGLPDRSGRACVEVLGQPDCAGRLHNRGHARPQRDSLSMPYGLAVWREWLLVADTANSRLLGWCQGDRLPRLLHGQVDFERAGDNRWQLPATDSLCWPYGLAVNQERLLIADTGNNRVQDWSLAPLSCQRDGLRRVSA